MPIYLLLPQPPPILLFLNWRGLQVSTAQVVDCFLVQTCNKMIHIIGTKYITPCGFDQASPGGVRLGEYSLPSG